MKNIQFVILLIVLNFVCIPLNIFNFEIERRNIRNIVAEVVI